MALDERGKACIAIIVFYAFALPVCLHFLFKHRPLSLKLGWLFLTSFSAVRIVGAAMLIDVETAKHPSEGLGTGAFIIIAVALTPLLIATMSFLHAVADNKGLYPALPFNNAVSLHVLHLAATAAVVLSALGATNSISHDSNSQDTGHTLRRAGGIVYAVLFLALVALHIAYWVMWDRMLPRKRNLLVILMTALPFLLIRVIYTTLSAFSNINPSSFVNGPLGARPTSGGLARFNLITGSATVFVTMGILMEFLVMLVYILFGVMVTFDWEGEEVDANSRGAGRTNSRY